MGRLHDLVGGYIACILAGRRRTGRCGGDDRPRAGDFPERFQGLVGHFPRFWGTVTSRPRIWYCQHQLLEGIDRRDAGGRHRGRVGSCRLRPEGDSQARPATGGSRGARSRHQFHSNRSTIRISAGPWPTPLLQARPAGACWSAAPASASRSRPTAIPRCAPRSSTTSPRRGCRASTTTPTSWRSVSALIGTETAREALRVFLATEWEGGRHAGRVDKLSKGCTI